MLLKRRLADLAEMMGERKDIYARGVCFLFFLIYLLTVSPQIFWRDGAEFVATAYSLSISHPPGSPTYNLLAKIATFFPIGSITFRVHLFSSLCAVATLFLIFKTLQLIFSRYLVSKEDSPSDFLSCSIALLSAGFFGFSFTFWRWSLCAEVYSLQNLFIISMVFLALYYGSGKEAKDFRLVFLIAFLFSLSLGAHMTNAMLLPAFFLFFFARLDRKIWSFKRGHQMVFFALLGFSVYLYLPLRYINAQLKPAGPPNLQHFWEHITASKVMFGSTRTLDRMLGLNEQLFPQIWLYVKHLAGELSLLGMVLGLIGIIYLAKKTLHVAGFMVLLFLGNILFFLRIWSTPLGFIPSFLIYSLWIGMGLFNILSLLEKNQAFSSRNWLRKIYIGPLLILLISFQLTITLAKNFEKNDFSNFYTVYNYGKNVLRSLEPYSAIITHMSMPQFPIWYFQFVENHSPGLASLPLEETSDGQIIERLLTNKGGEYNFYCVGGETSDLFYERLIPNGLIFRFNSLDESVPLTEQDFRKHLDYRLAWQRYLAEDRYANDYESYAEIGRVNNWMCSYYYLRKDLNHAKKEFRELIKIDPSSSILNLFYGRLLAENKEFQKAAYHLEKSLILNDHIYRGRLFDMERQNLFFGIGVIMLNNGHPKEAIRAFTYVIKEDPSSFLGHCNLAVAYLAAKKPRQALEEFKIALSLKPGDKETKKYIEFTQRILASNSNK